MEKRREEAMGEERTEGKRKEGGDGWKGGRRGKSKKGRWEILMVLLKRKYPCSFINTQLDKQNYTCAFCVHSIYPM